MKVVIAKEAQAQATLHHVLARREDSVRWFEALSRRLTSAGGS